MLTGNYTLQGQNPNGTAYKGTLEVQETNAVFLLTWQIGSSVHRGTGLLTDNILSVVWSTGNESGLATYRVAGNTLSGSWIGFGGLMTGKETATRVRSELN